MWPVVVDGGAEHDMRPTLPADSGACEFYYVTGLDDGWCALTYADGSGVGLAFDRAMYPSCWVFASYGGWRDLQVAVLEPCTGYPVSVADGLAAGTHRVLRAGERIETSMTLAIFGVTVGLAPLVLRQAGLFLPLEPEGPLVLTLFSIQIVYSAAIAISQIMTSAMIADCVEDSALRTGRHSAGAGWRPA